jgi:cobalt/nickel transport system permease protein
MYGVAGWVSVMLAALAVCVELAVSGSIAFGSVAAAMLGVHALIGIGEGVITAAVFALLAPRSVRGIIGRRAVILPLSAACLTALLLSPLASGLPDGLERVAETLGFLPSGGVSFWSPMAHYHLAAMGHGDVSIGVAGLSGVLLTFALSWLLARPLWARADEFPDGHGRVSESEAR